MTLYFTSDTHFSHRNILKYCPNRGEIWKDEVEMNAGLKDLWNKTVTPNDVVYLLGDVFFGSDVEWHRRYLQSLNGKKHLILGNHDHSIQKNIKYFLECFETISTYKRTKEQNQDIVLFHYGQRTWDKAHCGAWQLFGHTHNTLPPYGKSVDVGIDSSWVTGKHEHRPFSFDEIKKFMDGQKQIESFGD